jgi:hypothetical protein
MVVRNLLWKIFLINSEYFKILKFIKYKIII